jgi:uncharacterized protein YjbI with pentapeptide repeats
MTANNIRDYLTKRKQGEGVSLPVANLRDLDLSNADLSGADLSNARNLTQAQLNQACGAGAKLPPGLGAEAVP